MAVRSRPEMVGPLVQINLNRLRSGSSSFVCRFVIEPVMEELLEVQPVRIECRNKRRDLHHFSMRWARIYRLSAPHKHATRYMFPNRNGVSGHFLSGVMFLVLFLAFYVVVASTTFRVDQQVRLYFPALNSTATIVCSQHPACTEGDCD